MKTITHEQRFLAVAGSRLREIEADKRQAEKIDKKRRRFLRRIVWKIRSICDERTRITVYSCQEREGYEFMRGFKIIESVSFVFTKDDRIVFLVKVSILSRSIDLEHVDTGIGTEPPFSAPINRFTREKRSQLARSLVDAMIPIKYRIKEGPTNNHASLR